MAFSGSSNLLPRNSLSLLWEFSPRRHGIPADGVSIGVQRDGWGLSVWFGNKDIEVIHTDDDKVLTEILRPIRGQSKSSPTFAGIAVFDGSPSKEVKRGAVTLISIHIYGSARTVLIPVRDQRLPIALRKFMQNHLVKLVGVGNGLDRLVKESKQVEPLQSVVRHGYGELAPMTPGRELTVFELAGVTLGCRIKLPNVISFPSAVVSTLPDMNVMCAALASAMACEIAISSCKQWVRNSN